MQPELHLLQTLPDHKLKRILRDTKLFSESFPLDTRETVKAALKPYVETLLQVGTLPGP